MTDEKHVVSPREHLDIAVSNYGRSEYRRGLADGLAVAEKICGWLTMQPPRKWAQEIRGWGLEAIKKARKK